MSRARAPTACVLPQSETWTRLLARSCSAPTVGDQSLTPAERWSRKARPPRGRAASQQFYSCPSSRGAKSRPAETLDEFRGGSFGPGAKTEHLRVFIANEHKERLAAVAPVVVVPEDALRGGRRGRWQARTMTRAVTGNPNSPMRSRPTALPQRQERSPTYAHLPRKDGQRPVFYRCRRAVNAGPGGADCEAFLLARRMFGLAERPAQGRPSVWLSILR
jgi:hypothetical protein